MCEAPLSNSVQFLHTENLRDQQDSNRIVPSKCTLANLYSSKVIAGADTYVLAIDTHQISKQLGFHTQQF